MTLPIDKTVIFTLTFKPYVCVLYVMKDHGNH